MKGGGPHVSVEDAERNEFAEEHCCWNEAEMGEV